MPATPVRRRATSLVLAAVVALTVLTGCTHTQRAPGSYSGAEDNFLEGCVQTAQGDNEKNEADTVHIKSPTNYCQCTWNAITAKDGVSYSEFKKIQSRMQDEGGPLPDSYLEVTSRCDPASSSTKPSSSSSSSSDSTTTTTKDSDGTTTTEGSNG